ncbi:unnamed protein product [Symbiodinium natans]|uniref:Uncharacterized protein n=1 Tax=Symbiodinium natans TaxID=878477 RepID=A0A812R1H0_9DINO|nr:unnamed protein product [Symbiodinium natans]
MSWFARAQQDDRPTKSARKESDSAARTDVDKLLEMVEKLCLKNCLEVREMQAAVLRSYLLPRDSSLAVAATDAAKNHVEKLKEARNDQRAIDALGPVHVQVWAALVKAVRSAPEMLKMPAPSGLTLKRPPVPDVIPMRLLQECTLPDSRRLGTRDLRNYTLLVVLILRMC